MNTNTVSPTTARLLADAGFPQPAPAPGQWWSNGKNLIFIWKKWLDAKWEYIAVIEHLETPEPDVNRFYDISDFTGLIYLPTVGDILRHELAEGYGVSRQYDTNPSGVSWVCAPMEWSMPDMVSAMHETSEHEAAALAYLELKKN